MESPENTGTSGSPARESRICLGGIRPSREARGKVRSEGGNVQVRLGRQWPWSSAVGGRRGDVPRQFRVAGRNFHFRGRDRNFGSGACLVGSDEFVIQAASFCAGERRRGKSFSSGRSKSDRGALDEFWWGLGAVGAGRSWNVPRWLLEVACLERRFDLSICLILESFYRIVSVGNL